MNWRAIFPARCLQYLYARARSLQRGGDARRLAAQAGLPEVDRADIELVQTLLSIRASLKQKPQVLIDVGAHRGDFTKYAMPMLGFVRAECFEPDTDLVPVLSNRMAGLRANVHELALSNQSGSGILYVHPSRGMNSLLPSDPTILREKFSANYPDLIPKRSVPLATLDSVTANWASDRFFLKVDTQGNEMAVLAGAVNTLQNTDGCLIEYMFCSPYERTNTFEELVLFMSHHGFQCAGALEIKRRPTFEVSGVDFLFLKP